MLWTKLLAVLLSLVASVYATSRTSAPSGSIVVNAGTTTSGQYNTLASAVASLPADTSSRSIFIMPGTYQETVLIDRPGPVTIYGYTTDTSDYSKNQVAIRHSSSLATAGTDDATGTLRIHSDHVSLYNIDVHNDFGQSSTNGQALALSAYGSYFGAYACRFYSYQDTVLAEAGYQVYAKNYIEGAVDYIFGQNANAYFYGNTLASIGPGTITAAGPTTANGNLCKYFRAFSFKLTIYPLSPDVFESSTITSGSSASSSTKGNVYLGRPWTQYARVVFLDSIIDSVINPALWEQWSTSTPNTENIFFGDYGTTFTGGTSVKRASFATLLTSTQAATYSAVSHTLSSSYTSWVDTTYL